MSITDLQNSVNGKLPDNIVGAITPDVLRQALTLIISYLGGVSDQLGLASNAMATHQDITSVSTSVTSALSQLNTLAQALSSLSSFVNTPAQPPIADLQSVPAISLSLGSLTVLGNNQQTIINTVNQILDRLRTKKVIPS